MTHESINDHELLSPQQASIFGGFGDPGAPRVQAAVRWSAPVPPESIEWAMARVCREQPALRLRFRRVPGARYPVQEILDSAAIERVEVDPPRDDAAFEALLDRAAATPIDVLEGPRGWLHYFGTGCCLTISPLCLDVPSAARIVQAIAELAAGDAAGDAVDEAFGDAESEQEAPDPLALAVYFRESLEEEIDDRRFWEARSVGAALRWPLAVDGQGPRQAARWNLPLDPAVSRGLRELAGQAGVSVEATMLAAFCAFAHRMTGVDVLDVAVAAWGRDDELLRDAIAPLLRWVPLGSSFDRGLTLAQRASGWQRPLDQGRTHALGCDPELWRRSCTLAFCFVDQRVVPDEVTVRADDLDAILRLDVRDAGELAIALTADLSRLSAPAAEIAARSFSQWLGRIVADPERGLGQTPLTAPPAAALDSSRGATALFYERFCARARADAQASALVTVTRSRTYAELYDRASRIATVLKRRGIGVEDPVAVVLPRTHAVVEVLLGILHVGAAYLPIDPTLPSEAIGTRLRAAGAKLVVTLPIVDERIPGAIDRWCLDQAGETDEADEAADVPPAEPTPVTAHHLAYILFTSGSSGTPKAVGVEHGQISTYVEAVARRLGVLDEGVGLAYGHLSTLAADLGHTGLFIPLATGGTVVLLDEECMANGRRLAEQLRARPVDVMKITPSQLRGLMEIGGTQILPRRALLLGGEALDHGLVARTKACVPRVFNHYGPTETTVGSAMGEAVLDEHRISETVPLGTALDGERIDVVDPHGYPVPVGVAGELVIAGHGVTRGYLGRPGRTAERFVPDPRAPGGRMYRTGDRVRRLLDGSLEFLGRIDRQIKLRGYRIEPGEVEGTLVAHDGVEQAFVRVLPTPTGVRRLVAYVLLTPAAHADPGVQQQLRAFVKARLPAYMHPSVYVAMRSFPVTSNGKLDHAALPEPDIHRPELSTRYVPPRDDAERALVRIWSELLGIDRIGVEYSFFDLGGHSLLLVQLMSRIRDHFGCEIPIVEFFRHSTIESLATRIRQGVGDGEASASAGAQRARARGSARSRASRRASARTTARGSSGESR
ncbi:MAG: amino acid adenylation domain-containing protein [Myxococcota bacterium]